MLAIIYPCKKDKIIFATKEIKFHKPDRSNWNNWTIPFESLLSKLAVPKENACNTQAHRIHKQRVLRQKRLEPANYPYARCYEHALKIDNMTRIHAWLNVPRRLKYIVVSFIICQNYQNN